MSKWEDLVYYDETSSTCLRWKDGARAGSEAGTLDTSNGYFKIWDGMKTHYVHRVVYEMLSGNSANGFEIDHVNGKRTDNRYKNLRRVEHALNGRNTKLHITNSSGVVGVSKNIQKRRTVVYEYWQASCTRLDGKNVTKSFSVLRFGDEEAFRKACEWRIAMIEELNARGAGYSSRHGEDMF